MKNTLTAIAVMAIASVASAAPLLTSSTTVVQFEGQDYTVVTLVAEAADPTDANDIVAAFDASFQADQSGFVQAWLTAGRPPMTPSTKQFYDTDPEKGIDSHVMLSEILGGGDIVLEEDQTSVELVTEFFDVGLGSYMTLIGGLATADMKATRPLFQLVFKGNMPDLAPVEGGTTGEAVYDIELANDAGDKFSFSGAIVPEPATMTLLAIGGLGALIRRKRR